MAESQNSIQALHIFRDKHNAKLETTRYEQGPDANFVATVIINHNGKVFTGQAEGKRKKEAEEKACRKVLDKLANDTNTTQPSSKKLKHVAYSEEIPENTVCMLQKLCFDFGLPSPEYTIETEGPSHAPIHTISCTVGTVVSKGSAKKSGAAKNIAANEMRIKLEKEANVVASSVSKSILQSSKKSGPSEKPSISPATGSPTDSSPPVPSTSQAQLHKLITKQQPVMIEPSMKKVVKNIFYDPKQRLGSESDSNSSVFEGVFIDAANVNKPVAVKRLFQDETANDLRILINLNHPYIIKYFISEQCPNTNAIFIAMERASETLETFVKRNTDTLKIRSLLEQSTEGLCYLHSKNIIHRDIKPSNILVCAPQNVAKLADFGISKEIQSAISEKTIPKGTHIWMPPEALLAMSRSEKHTINKYFDVFSLGLTMFYAMTREHPFTTTVNNSSVGTNFMIPQNIMEKEPNWDKLQGGGYFSVLNLLQKMLSKEPKERPSTSILLEHPFFWNNEKCVRFITAAANDLKEDEKMAKMMLKKSIQEEYIPFWNFWQNKKPFNWEERLCSKVQDFIKKRTHEKKYRHSRFTSLLEFIRDHNQHYGEWEQAGLNTDNYFGKTDETYGKYFTEKFPELIPFLYTFFQDKPGMKVNEFYKHNSNSSFKKLRELPIDKYVHK